MASSETKSSRLIEDGAHDGAFNMAADYQLAQQARRSTLPVLRFYQWNKPTLSLGYHQHIGENILSRCVKEGIPVVRRPTGGRAVLHDNELTYCLTLPMEHHLFRKHRDDLLKSIGSIFVTAAQSLGLDAEQVRIGRGGDLSTGPLRKGSPLCFDAVSRWEVRLAGKKWIGSAQRFFPGVLLQHGSILLGESSADVNSLFGLKPSAIPFGGAFDIQAEVLRGAIIQAFKELWRIQWKPRSWSKEETQLILADMEQYRIPVSGDWYIDPTAA